jgi:hypothetical protein
LAVEKTKLGSGLLIVVLLVLAAIAGAWYWSQPRFEVTVTGTLPDADIAEITQVVQREFLGQSKSMQAYNHRNFASRLLAKLEGKPSDRMVIEIDVLPDGTVKASAAYIFPGRGAFGTGYEMGRGTTGWEITNHDDLDQWKGKVDQ